MVRKIWNSITTVLAVVAALTAILLVGVRLIGLQPYTVLSGSMEPKYPVGSTIYVKKVDTNTLGKEDAITFTIGSGTVVTHEIIEVLEDENGRKSFRTQGIANDTPDGDLVPAERVIGKPVFCLPLLGYAAVYFQTPAGKLTAIAACAALVLMMMLSELLFAKDGKGGKATSGEAEQ